MKKLVSLLLSAILLISVSSCDTARDIVITTVGIDVTTTDTKITTGNTTAAATTTDTEKVEPLPKIREEIDWDTYVMPEPFGTSDGGGDVQAMQFSMLCHDDVHSQLEGLPLDVVETFIDLDDFYAWVESPEMAVLFDEPQTSLLGYPNLYSFAVTFEIPADEFKAALKKDQALSIKIDSPEKFYFTDEEIELVCSYDEARIMERFVSDYSIYNDGKIYTPSWIYRSSPKEYQKAGITAEMLGEKLDLYEGFWFTREAAQLFEAKLYEFTGREVDFVDFLVEVTE